MTPRMTPEQKRLRAAARREGLEARVAIRCALFPVYDDGPAWERTAVKHARRAWRHAVNSHNLQENP